MSPNDNPLPLIPNRAQLDPTSNWLQSSSDTDSDHDHDQFMLNANDIYSDDAWSSCSSDNQDKNNQNDFEINYMYIGDDIEPLQGNTDDVNCKFCSSS